MSNLKLLNTTTIGSSVANVDVTNVFSGDYRIYKIVSNGISTASTTATEVYLRYINDSDAVVEAGYTFAAKYMPADAGFSEIRNTNTSDTTKIHYASGTADQVPEVAAGVLYVFNPFEACYTYNTGEQSSHYSNPRYLATKGFGSLVTTASITGFRFMFPSSNVSSGEIKTYGLQVD